MTKKTVLTNAIVYVFRQGRHLPEKTRVLIDEGIIEAVGDRSSSSRDCSVVDLDGLLLVPGAFDTHCHGGGRLTNCTEGEWSPEKRRFIYDPRRLREIIARILEEHARHGTTSMFLSAMATALPRLKNFLETGGEFCGNEGNGAILEGLDLEGPFLCAADGGRYIGAMNPAFLHPPTIAEYRKVVGNNPHVRKVGIGLEYGEPALKLVRYLGEREIAVAIGHSGAGEKQVLRLLEKTGKLVYLHLGNGPNASNFKPGQARVMESLAPALRLARRKDYAVYAEQILDGAHIDARFTVSMLSQFGKAGLLGVTDNIGITGAPAIREFTIAGTTAVISRNNPRAIWVKGQEGITLCGSKATTMDHLLLHYLNVLTRPVETGETGITGYNAVEPLFKKPLSFDEAMDYCLDALCLNPARAYGAVDRIGSIEVGKEANLVALKIRSKNPFRIDVEHVWIRGRKVK